MLVLTTAVMVTAVIFARMAGITFDVIVRATAAGFLAGARLAVVGQGREGGERKRGVAGGALRYESGGESIDGVWIEWLGAVSGRDYGK
jgi:hypothetical protein